MNTTTAVPELSAAQKRFLRGFRHSMKKRVMFHLDYILKECHAQTVDQKHIMAAISRAHSDYERDGAAAPTETMEESMAAYKKGNWISSKEWLDELRGQIPRSDQD